MSLDFEVDLVYLWCDGDDPEFQKKRSEALKQYSGIELHKEGTSSYRFVETEELKYSLRSVEKFAPWIKNIYIVTAGQTPKWLNTSNPKIKIIDHKDIIPEKYLPTFNSSVIELFLPYIPNLSEHFLYANDDMFFWDDVTREFFFTSIGTPIVRTSSPMKTEPKTSLFGSTLYNAYKLVFDKFNKTVAYWSHHGIDSYKKSDFLECLKHFENQFNEMANHKFREHSDIQRMVFSFYSVAEKGAQIKEYPRKWYDKYVTRINETCYSNCTIRKIRKYQNKKFQLFCINDCKKTTDKDRLYMKKILEEKFPQKSAYEI